MSLKGIDVSEHNAIVDYADLAAYIDFAIVREGYRLATDGRWHQHLEGFRKAGVQIKGVYHFLYALSSVDARKEAENCIRNVKAAGLPDDTWIFADFEYDSVYKAALRGVTLGANECRLFTETFCRTVTEAGYRAGIYSNIDYYRRMYGPDIFTRYPLWLADYEGEPDFPCMIRQYSSKGGIGKYTGNLDKNVWLEEVDTTATRYNLTDLQLRHLAIICDREQGKNIAGVKACASQMCNYYEKWQSKKYKSIYECVFASGWYRDKTTNTEWVAEHPNVSAEVIDAVRDVMVNGHRTLPNFVDEYDQLQDVAIVVNDGVSHTDKAYILNRNNYVKDKTRIRNAYAKDPNDWYTFYCFPDGVSGSCDAFGYITKPANAGPDPSIYTKTAQELAEEVLQNKYGSGEARKAALGDRWEEVQKIVTAIVREREAAAMASNTIGAAESAARWMEALAADNSHGYSQANRWGPNYDCSSSVITAYEQAGVPVKTNGATYTGNMRAVFLRCGFKDVTAQVDLNTGAGLLRSDVLLYHIGGTSGHTAMYVGNGKIAHARGQSYGSPASGDQGSEIAVTSYTRSKWQYVLRYTGSATVEAPTATPITIRVVDTATKMPELKIGSTGAAVAVLQGILTLFGAVGSNDKALTIDGDFGANTAYALKAYQTAVGLTADGVCGAKTWERLKLGMTV